MRHVMAHIWIRSDADGWQPVALVADACALTVAGPIFGQGAGDPGAGVGRGAGPSGLNVDVGPDPLSHGTSAVRLRRVSRAGDDTWALFAGPTARPLVNGLPSPIGLVILSDRDEIRWLSSHDPSGSPAHPLFFSTERLASIAPYPAGERRGLCPRCKQPLTPGDAAVRCPGCGLWHHATDALKCWTYGEHCAACQQTTSLDAGFQWTPEDL
jgi:hypothetical protein